MNQGKFVFAQIMDRVPWRRLQTCVDRYQGNHKVQTFKCADYFRVMAFAQLTYRESLRDIVACLNAVPEKMVHMGILAVTGAKRPESPITLPGLDLTEFIKTDAPLNRNTIFGEGFGHDIPDIDDAITGRLYRWCIEDNWKLLLSDPGGPGTRPDAKYDTDQPQLFDLSIDPTETTNLAAVHPEIVQRLTKKNRPMEPGQVKKRCVKLGTMVGPSKSRQMEI